MIDEKLTTEILIFHFFNLISHNKMLEIQHMIKQSYVFCSQIVILFTKV